VQAAIRAPAAPATASPPRPAHLAAAIQARPAAVSTPPRAPHVEAAIQARPAPSAVPPRARHVQTAIDRTRSPGGVQAKAALGPELIVQRMKRKKSLGEEKKEEPEKRGSKRKKRRVFYQDPFTFLDDPNFGKTKNYEKKRAKFDRQQHEKFKKVKKKLGNLEKIPHVSSKKKTELGILDTETFLKSFESLKGNTESENFVLKVAVSGETHLFKTSYNQDVGLAPLYLGEDELFRATKNRPFIEIAGDLDDFIDGDKSLRKQVGAMVKAARDGKEATWSKKPKKKKRLTLESAIAELAIIFRLDLARAGEYSDQARSHQNALLRDSSLGFQDMLAEHYIGIKAARLRDPEEYENSEY
jgi:hypothetical protein